MFSHVHPKHDATRIFGVGNLTTQPYCGWLRNPFRPTLNPWVRRLFVGMHGMQRGTKSFQGFLGGAVEMDETL